MQNAKSVYRVLNRCGDSGILSGDLKVIEFHKKNDSNIEVSRPCYSK